MDPLDGSSNIDVNIPVGSIFSILENSSSSYPVSRYSTYSELIWPMPNETYDTLKNGIQRVIELGQNDFLMVHPLVITFNATMGHPWYIKKYGLEMVVFYA